MQGARYCACGCGGRTSSPTARYIAGHWNAKRKVRLVDAVVRGNPDDCWEWTGRLNNAGYGMVGGQGLAHRLAYIEALGPVPDGMCVLHRCDNRQCCNPAHMFLGTKTDNAADRDAKGRTYGGRGPRPLALPEPPRGETRHLRRAA